MAFHSHAWTFTQKRPQGLRKAYNLCVMTCLGLIFYYRKPCMERLDAASEKASDKYVINWNEFFFSNEILTLKFLYSYLPQFTRAHARAHTHTYTHTQTQTQTQTHAPSVFRGRVSSWRQGRRSVVYILPSWIRLIPKNTECYPGRSSHPLHWIRPPGAVAVVIDGHKKMKNIPYLFIVQSPQDWYWHL